MKITKRMMLKLAGMLLFMLCMGIGIGNTAHAQTTITPPMLKAGGSTRGAKSYQFKIKGTKELTIPMSVSKAGKVCLEASGNTKEVFIIISSKANQGASGGWTSISPSSTGKVSAYIKKKGKYYIHAFIGNSQEDSQTALKIKAYEIPVSIGNAGTLSKGKWISTSGAGAGLEQEEDLPAYFKIKAPSSGCVKIEIKKIGKSENYIEAELTNSKKKRLMSNVIEQDGITAYFGVKKGTYYVKVNTRDTYKIRYTFENAADKKNTTKKKAISLKQKKTEKGLFAIDDKESNWYKAKSRWYKIRLKKPQTLKLTLKASINKSSGFYYRINDMEPYKRLPGGKKQFKKKLKAGTYYLEISTQGLTGSYSITWN